MSRSQEVDATRASRDLTHVGEWKLELRAPTLRSLFVELACRLADAVGPPAADSAPQACEHVELAARDPATLLVDWANELVGRSEVAGLAYGDVQDLAIESLPDGSHRLTADIHGHPVTEWVTPVKAATYHDASVAREGGGWRAVVLLDV